MLNRRMPNGMYGGVRGEIKSPLLDFVKVRMITYLQQRKSEKLSGTGKICRNGGRHPQRNCFCPVRIGRQRHCSQLLRQPHRWEER